MITEATRAAIEDGLPVGLYAVMDDQGQPIEAPRFDFLTGAQRQLRLMARVREVGDLPDGVESIAVRGDGKVVIYQFVLWDSVYQAPQGIVR